MKIKVFYSTFATKIGTCAIAWIEEAHILKAVVSLALPDKNEQMLKEKLFMSARSVLGKQNLTSMEDLILKPNSKIMKKIILILQKHLQGDLQSNRELNSIPLYWKNIKERAPFSFLVLKSTQKIKAGEVLTYGQIACQILVDKQIGVNITRDTYSSPKGHAARAVGQALARNPFPLLVPCHRVVGAKKNLCGFSAFRGIDLKRELLKLEGVECL